MKRLIVDAALIIVTMVAPAAAQQTECINTDACLEVYGLSEAEILDYEEPDVAQLPVDQKLLHDRAYKQVSGFLEVYDSPNGNVIRTLDAGFNFLTSINSIEGWTEINPGEWVKTDQLKSTNYVVSNFSGILLPEIMPEYPIAWMLVNVYPATEPGGMPNETVNDLVYRYTRVNLYSTVEVDGWRWYQIGVNQWVHQTQVAKIIPVERPEAVETEQWIGIDLYEQVVIAYEGDRPVFATLISSGLPRWPTYEGIFNIYWRRTREDMTWGTPGDDFYYLEEVPWTMFFDEGRALHGAYWHDGFGYRRSHGCVNMSITDAFWMYNWVADAMGTRASADTEVGPNVYVYSSGSYIE
jgi:hypothetical protein